MPDDSEDTPGVKNFVEIALSHTFSEINVYLQKRSVAQSLLL